MYIPAAQVNALYLSVVHVWFQPDWVVRTYGPFEGLTAEMQRVLASVDPNLPFSGFYRMRDLLAKTLATQRVDVALLSTMAALALLLCAIGIFALVANIVAQKTREISIRMALGSTIPQAMINIARSRSAGVGARTLSGFGLVRRGAEGDAQRPLRSRCLRPAHNPLGRFDTRLRNGHCWDRAYVSNCTNRTCSDTAR